MVLCFLLQQIPAVAQTARITVVPNRDNILLGEPVEVRVKAELPADWPEASLFSLPDTFNTLEVLHRGKMDSSVVAAVKTYTQSFTLTGFDSGTWAMPPLMMQSGNRTIRSNPLNITVLPVRLPADSTYHDIREIIEIEKVKDPWWLWLIAAVVAAIAGLLLYRWLKTKKRVKPTPVAKTPDPDALQDALNKIKQLEAEQLPAKGEWKKYYSALTDIVKIFMEKRTGQPANAFTTDEVIVLGDNYLPKEKTGLLAETLRIADAVKFAKYQPGEPQAKTDIVNVAEVLRQIDKKFN